MVFSRSPRTDPPPFPKRPAPTAEVAAEQRRLRRLRAGTALGAVGIEMCVAVVLGALGGDWLDKRYATAPTAFLLGTLAGIGAAVTSLVRVLRSTRGKG